MKKVLVTGGCGYIGSHTVLGLLDKGYSVTIIDNFSNSSSKSLDSIKKLSNNSPKFYKVDILDKLKLSKVVREGEFDAIMHFAAHKSIIESYKFPEKYYENNIVGTLNLLDVMNKFDVRKLIFSSSATIYGQQNGTKVKESAPIIMPNNPYGKSKYIVENIIADFCSANKSFCAVNLRYFNPAGAHESGDWGECSTSEPTNLMPIISEVAAGLRDKLLIYGKDYFTHDGTGVRDYIHISDLASGHIAALSKCINLSGCLNINLGSGKGVSVLEMISEFSKVSGNKIHYEIVERRDGDIAFSVADISKAKKILSWAPKKTIKQICEDMWRWQTKSKIHSS